MALERDTLTAMAAFLAAVDTGSFSGAAAKLGMTPSGVSKLVARLEGRLKTRLFRRSTRQMTLTDLGALYFERSRRIFEDLDALETMMEERDDVPRGVLRLTAPVVLGHVRVLPAVVAFRKTFPEVKVDLLLVDRVVDLIEERIDLAIRMTASPPQASIAKKLGDDVRTLCASPEYLERRGRPTRPQDLNTHDCLAFVPGGASDGPSAPWRLHSEAGKPVAFRVCGPMQVNNTLSLHEAALAGLGIADLPLYLVAEDLRAGRLQTVLDEFVVADRAVYAVYPGRPVPARVREFVKLLVRQFESLDEQGHRLSSGVSVRTPTKGRPLTRVE
jgi:DNA-binding transcriptional LysR family regulator